MQVREETRDCGEGEVGDEKQRVEDQKKSPRPKLGTHSSCRLVQKETFISNQLLPESPGLLVEK